MVVLTDGRAMVVGGLGEPLSVLLASTEVYGAATSVGGIAEQPHVTALRSAASGRTYKFYIVGGAVAFIVAAAGAAAWRKQRA